MFRKKRARDKEKERYYLLPGQGGKAYRRKQRIFLIWSVVVALGVAAIFAAVAYLVNRSMPPSH